MSHHKVLDWEPEDLDTYKGHNVYDHGIHADDINCGCADAEAEE